MQAFQLELGSHIAYNGLNQHQAGEVVGIDSYSKIENSVVVKTWVSYSITSSPELEVATQMKRGDRWWITWDGTNLREWIYATVESAHLSGKIVESITGEIAVRFAGDSGLSTSRGHLYVYQQDEDTALWHAKEEFYTASGDKEVIYFLSKPIPTTKQVMIVSA